MARKLQDILIVILMATLIGIIVFAVMDIEHKSDDTLLHDNTMVFCEYWNDGIYSDCEEWTRQTLANHREDVHYCLSTYEVNSWPEFGCMSEVVK